MSTIIKRSGARALPPSADHVRSEVTVVRRLPAQGAVLAVIAPCGVTLQVRVKEITALEEGWIGWADVLAGREKELLQAGVPACSSETPMRIFSWQVRS